MKASRIFTILVLLLTCVHCFAQDYPTVYCHTSGRWSDWNFSTNINDKTQLNIGGTGGYSYDEQEGVSKFDIANYIVVVPNGISLEIDQECRVREIIIEEGGRLDITQGIFQADEITVNGEFHLHENNSVVTQASKFAPETTAPQSLYVKGSGILTIPNRDKFLFTDDSPILEQGIVRETLPNNYNGYRFYSCGNGDWNDGTNWSLYENVKVHFYDLSSATYRHPGLDSEIHEEIHVKNGNEITLEGTATIGSLFVDGILHICGNGESKAEVICTDQWASGGVHEGVITIGEDGVIDLCETASLEVPLGTITINGEIKGQGEISGYKIDANNATISDFDGKAYETAERDYWDYYRDGHATFVAMQSGQWDQIAWGWQTQSGLVIENKSLTTPHDNQGVTVIIPQGITVNQTERTTEYAHTIIYGKLSMCDPGMWKAANQYSQDTMVEVYGILEICQNSTVNIDGTLKINEGGRVICNGQLIYKYLIGNIDDIVDNNLVFTTLNDGAWEDPNSWNKGSVPQSTDIAFIKHNISVTRANAIRWVVITENGSLNINNTTGNFSVIHQIEVEDKGHLKAMSPIDLPQDAIMKVQPGAVVEVFSSITTTSANQIIISNSSELSASFYTGNGCILNNGVTVERGLEGGKIYTAGSATKEGTINSGLDSNDIFVTYDTEANNYANSTNFGGTFNTGQMKLASKGTSERVITQIGTIEQGDKTYELKITDGANFGWNLIQNPFTTSIGIKDEPDGIFTYDNDYVEPTLWFYININGTYQFVTYSMETDIEVPSNSQGRWADNIAPQQAFFIKAYDATSDFTIRYPQKAIARTGLKAAKAEANDVLRLTISSPEYNTDEMALVFRNGSLDHIKADSQKRYDGSLHNQIYGIKDNKTYSIPVYPNAEEVFSELIPIGVQISSLSNECTISAIMADNFTVADNVYLYDAKTEEKTNLREECYTFTKSETTENNRFFIEISGNKSVPTSTDQRNAIDANIVKSNNGISVDVFNASHLTVYDISGKVIESKKLVNGHYDVLLNSHGAYIVEIKTDEGSVTRRKIVR